MTNYTQQRMKAGVVGLLILAAYSMLTYDVTRNIPLGIMTDVISGLSVIGIAVFMYPIFQSTKNKLLNLSYVACKIIEGALMILGGVLILSPALVPYRGLIYQDIHIYFFTFGALFFYMLLYRTLVVPKFISQWGIFASLALLVITLLKVFGITHLLLDILVAPMILNEVFLALWLMIKGFSVQTETVSHSLNDSKNVL